MMVMRMSEMQAHSCGQAQAGQGFLPPPFLRESVHKSVKSVPQLDENRKDKCMSNLTSITLIRQCSLFLKKKNN